MKVYASIRQEVDVDPRDVLEKIKDNLIGDGWVEKKDGKYYRGYEQSAGCHSTDEYEEITVQKYLAVKSIDELIKYFRDE